MSFSIEFYIGGGLKVDTFEIPPGLHADVLPLNELIRGHEPVHPAVIIATPAEAQGISSRLIDNCSEYMRLIVVNAHPRYRLGGFFRRILHGELPPLKPKDLHPLLRTLVQSAVEFLRSRADQEELGLQLSQLNDIGIALSSVNDSERLLDMILESGRQIAACDAGSLYLVADSDNGSGKYLYFVAAQNDSVHLPFMRRRLKLDQSSIAGYVAQTGRELLIEDVYNIPADEPYDFNRDFDVSSGYRSVNMLTVPMVNQKGDVRGVLQLINRKEDNEITLRDSNAIRSLVKPYDRRIVQLVRSLASQAAVALDNSRLYENIQRLFDGFVKASVVAIEARDPSTMGHSARVSWLSVALAEAVNQTNTGPLAGLHFSENEINVVKYAALLHDFGKVGVREHVLLKAKKLPPHSEDMLGLRIRLMKALLREDKLRREIEILLEHGPETWSRARTWLEAELVRNEELTDHQLAFVLERNRAYFCSPEDAKKVHDIAETHVMSGSGEDISLITPREAAMLSIKRGTLSSKERRDIESHVTYTYEFLRRIPWSKELSTIPEVAYSHHEMIDGTGYPRALSGGDIPILSKIIEVCDLYDVLTSSDRPYKKALSVEKSLSILDEEVARGRISGDVVQVFKESQVYSRIHQQYV